MILRAVVVPLPLSSSTTSIVTVVFHIYTDLKVLFRLMGTGLAGQKPFSYPPVSKNWRTSQQESPQSPPTLFWWLLTRWTWVSTSSSSVFFLCLFRKRTLPDEWWLNVPFAELKHGTKCVIDQSVESAEYRCAIADVQDKVYLCLTASDSPGQDLSQYFSQCNDFIHKARLDGGSVLVHWWVCVCVSGLMVEVSLFTGESASVSPVHW